MTKPTSALLPVLSLLLAASLWGVIWYPLRLLETAGLSGLWSTLTCYGAAFVVGLLPMRARLHEWRSQPLALLVLTAAAGWCNVAFVLAVLEGTIVRVLLLFYLSPIWAVLLARIVLGEQLSRQARGVFALALVGALVMLWDPRIGLPWPGEPGDWWAVSAGVGFALANVMTRLLQQVSVQTKTMASWTGVLVIAVMMLALDGGLRPPAVDATVWFGALALGGIGIVVMTLAVQYGVTHMPVHRSAVILLFELIAGAVSSGLLSDEVVRPLEWLGGILIIVAAYWAARLQTHA